jgi:signal transduction histidine kinase
VAGTGLVERLAAHRTLGSAPRAQLEWLAAHGELRRIPVGESTASENQAITGLWVLLTGHVTIRVDRGAGPRKVMEWTSGDVSGLLPYSRLSKSPGTARADEETEILFVSREHFPEMIRECHELTAILVHVMLDRARVFTSSDQQVEKILSLGRLAAGLAHELNNPASAVERSAATLKGCLADVETASQALAAARLSDVDLEAIREVHSACSTASPRGHQSPIERADREDEIATYLDRHGVDGRLAESLADSVVTVEAFDQLAATLGGDKLPATLQWISAICAARGLANEIEISASRIHHLVAAVRGFTYLDQAAVPKPVNIGQGLSDTLVVLGSKARTKSVATTLAVAPGLPAVDGYGGELNQVWANLIDNALDAVPATGGRVDVSAVHEGRFVVVRVADNGPGIPESVQQRVFEPFFTTKPVGVGTGLGLDIARRIVNRHDGILEFDTGPGGTEFRVMLPAAQGARES